MTILVSIINEYCVTRKLIMCLLVVVVCSIRYLIKLTKAVMHLLQYNQWNCTWPYFVGSHMAKMNKGEA